MVNRALRWRDIQKASAGHPNHPGCGWRHWSFLYPLARRGFAVTHVTRSATALSIAREKAAGLTNIRLVEANVADLSIFADPSFDLVINMDGAISFSGSKAIDLRVESCRLARKKPIVTVFHRGRLIPVWLESSICSQAALQYAVADDRLFAEFLDISDRYDREVAPDGPGTRQRSGLIAVTGPLQYQEG